MTSLDGNMCCIRACDHKLCTCYDVLSCCASCCIRDYAPKIILQHVRPVGIQLTPREWLKIGVLDLINTGGEFDEVIIEVLADHDMRQAALRRTLNRALF